jgi:hypothetical protein
MVSPTNRSESAQGKSGLSDLRPTTKFSIFMFLNIAIVVVVFFSWRYGYTNPPRFPRKFRNIEIVLTLSGCGILLLGWLISTVGAGTTGKEHEQSNLVNAWLILRDRVIAICSPVFAVALIAALWQLALETGGIDSPFVALLPAPAIFGPFFTQRRLVVAALVVINGILIADVDGDGRSEITPAGHLRSPAQTHLPRDASFVDHRVFAVLAIVLLAISGIMNMFRIERRNPGRVSTWLSGKLAEYVAAKNKPAPAVEETQEQEG